MKAEEQEETKCSNCDGVGTVFEGIYPIGDCPVCDGTGTIQEQPDPLESEEFRGLINEIDFWCYPDVHSEDFEALKSFIREKFKIK